MTIDTTDMCSHLQKRLFGEDGDYHPLWLSMQDDPELTAVVRSRQLHVYRNGKKILVLAGKSARNRAYVEGLITNGGPAINTVRDMLGAGSAETMFRRFLFGTE